MTRGGHLECLKYLHEKEYPWYAESCSAAAEEGHFECLQYLHVKGCPWNESICTYATSGGHLECLTYLHENGCPTRSFRSLFNFMKPNQNRHYF